MGIDSEDRVTSNGLIKYARDYLNAYKILDEKKPKPLLLYQVKFYLLCHSVELALKAKLRAEGYLIKELKRIGHDLTLLIHKLETKTRIPLPVDYLQLISEINFYYKDKQFEYFQSGYKELVDIKQLEKITENIINIFENILLKRTAFEAKF